MSLLNCPNIYKFGVWAQFDLLPLPRLKSCQLSLQGLNPFFLDGKLIVLFVKSLADLLDKMLRLPSVVLGVVIYSFECLFEVTYAFGGIDGSKRLPHPST